MKPTELPKTIGGVILSAATTVVVGSVLVIGLTGFYLAIWSLGHMKKPTYHGRRLS